MTDHLDSIGVDTRLINPHATGYVVIPTSRYPDGKGRQGKAFHNIIMCSLETVSRVTEAVDASSDRSR